MDANFKERLEAAGVNVDTAMKRFMNSEALLERFLRKFRADTNFQKLKDDLASGDCEEAFKTAHTLKGVCGNLSLDGLFEVVSRQTELLRGGDLDSAKAMLPELEELYNSVNGGIIDIYP